ncbi:DUF2937 family protein [Rhodoligotrophos ferricapiens]|uniref:DUF2937 family protein n=1 Tax=Rhodoligotrophos ferricapiens TaxID=3069264 RepID=UPI00315D726D
MLARTLALAVGLFCGIVTSQLPEFGQQYRQRLGGAIDELRGVMRNFDADAQASGFDQAQALQHLEKSTDPFLQRRAASISQTVQRLDKLERQRLAFDTAGRFGRLITLIESPDSQILNNTVHDFEPAVPVTSEGFIIGGVGFVTGWLVLRLLGFILRGRRRKRAAINKA